MNINNFFLLLIIIMCPLFCHCEETTLPQINPEPIHATQDTMTVQFTPPTGWLSADTKTLPKHVYYMVVGKGKREFPPSINLGIAPFKGSLKDYLKIVKSINDAQGIAWKDLGSIRTEAGMASLSQVEMHTQWGEIKEMHVILIKDGSAYILTAAALKDEFPDFYKEFFKSMRSLRFEEISKS